MRVAVAGFLHETNTFLPDLTGCDAFTEADAWPPLLRGEAIMHGTQGQNLPIAGFLETASAYRWDIVPILWCSAAPSGPVAQDTYDHLAHKIVSGIAEAGDIDAIFLDLHGAMVAEETLDADGALLCALRRRVGVHVIIVAAIDFHANVSPLMAESADALLSYRTYPHTDMAATGRRAANRLKAISQGRRPKAALTKLPFLIPMGCQSTLDLPMQKIIAAIEHAEAHGDTIEFTAGFPLADVPECGPAVIAYGEDAETNSAALAKLVTKYEPAFQSLMYTPSQALRQIKAIDLQKQPRPVLLIDTQDNPGCGGTGDTVGLLRYLLCANIPGTVLGILCDAETCRQAHGAGVGAEIQATIGARHGFREVPISVSATVLALGDGCFSGTGPFYQGCHFNLGAMARLAVGNVQIILSSKKQQAADQTMFRHLGTEPGNATLLALKSSVHWRADFGTLACRVFTIASPGANIADLTKLSYRRLPHHMRIAGAADPAAPRQAI